MPDITALKADSGAVLVTFPKCALGAAAQKYTSLLCSRRVAPMLQSLSHLRCEHVCDKHIAGGSKTSAGWNSKMHLAYPPDFNFHIARVLSSLRNAPLTLGAAQPPPQPSVDVTATQPAPPANNATQNAGPGAGVPPATQSPDGTE
eukprot:4544060-Pleurochrysis_carterae.AAC.2